MEIVVGQQGLGFTQTFNVQGDDFAERMILVGVGVVFPSADDTAMPLIDHFAAVPEIGLGRNGNRCFTRSLPVDPLVRIVGEIHNPIGYGVAAGAVLVHHGDRTEAGWSNVHQLAVWGAFHDYGPAILGGPNFGPISVRPIQGYSEQFDGAVGNHFQ